MLDWITRFGVWYGTRPRPSLPRRTPEYLGLAYEEVTFPTASQDGIALSGWFIPCAEARGVIILCHGLIDTRLRMLPKAALLHRFGYASLLFDSRARGQSEGERCTLGAREPEDTLGAIRYLAEREETRGLPIGAIGESMGGASVLIAAARDERLRAVVAEAPFSTLEGAVGHHVRWFLGPVTPRAVESCRAFCRETLDLDTTAVSPLDVIDQIAPRPILLICDTLDLVCPRAAFEQLFAQARPPKEFWLAPRAPHVRAFQTAPQEYERRVGGFFRRYLGPAQKDEG